MNSLEPLDQAWRRRDAEALSNLGVTLAQQGKLDEAIPTLREAVRLKPDYAQAQHNLGVALAHRGQAEEAIACFRLALQSKPNYAEACYNLGNLLAEGKSRDEAVAVYRRALEIKPDYGDAYNNLGLLLLDQAGSEKVSDPREKVLSPFQRARPSRCCSRRCGCGRKRPKRTTTSGWLMPKAAGTTRRSAAIRKRCG